MRGNVADAQQRDRSRRASPARPEVKRSMEVGSGIAVVVIVSSLNTVENGLIVKLSE